MALPAGYMRALALQVQCRRTGKVGPVEQSMNSPCLTLISRRKKKTEWNKREWKEREMDCNSSSSSSGEDDLNEAALALE